MTALDWLESLQGSGIRPGLARMRAILRALGNPHRAYRSIIVAGTNGKGSTCSTLASILDAAGYRTGLYTSPHLVDIRERWMIGHSPVSEESLVEAIEILRRTSRKAGIKPTYFEALTLIAFIIFEREGCEIAVLEVGMGGRLDATNVVRPIAALITPIGLDHTEYLGNTIRKIAREKAGVIHRGAIVLTNNHDPAVLSVLRRRAATFDCPFHEVRSDGSEHPVLRGDFQRENAALAIHAAEELKSQLPKISRAAIRRGVAATQWRGRLERVVIAGKEIWVDGVHNAHAANVVAPFIARHIKRPRLLVFGIMSDKDVTDVATLLFPLFDEIITTEPYPPRSKAARELAEMARSMNVKARAVREPRAAIRSGLASDARAIFVGGSLYLAGAAVEFLDKARKR
ncbi:MAG TPA: folylpolyglutamate synthase/dihydrofolate synthase family protein [Thermoanaerobaculia bacterium]|nr:folylpolyglutamate synthase/dihydrofolate synthase family protein [Thermoanaerobaculia bacterium]